MSAEENETIVQLRERINELEASNTNYKNRIGELEKNNKDLTSYNNKLFARVTQEQGEKDEPPVVKTPEEKEQELVDDILKIMEEN